MARKTNAGTSIQAPSAAPEIEAESYRGPFTLERYLAAFRKYPVLTDPFEIDAIYEQYHFGKTEALRTEAFERLQCGNVRLVVRIARPFLRSGFSFPELMQEGMLGLRRGIELYAPDGEDAFSTFVESHIRARIRRVVQDHSPSRPMRIPVHVLDVLRVLRTAEARFWRERHRDPTDVELLREVKNGKSVGAAKITMEILARTRPYLYQSSRSRDQPISSQDGGDELLLGDVIGCETPSPETVLDAKRVLVTCKELLSRIEAALPKVCSLRNADIIRRRLGLDDAEPWTLDQIALLHGITREGTRQIEVKETKKLSRHLGVPAEEIWGLRAKVEELVRFLSCL